MPEQGHTPDLSAFEQAIQDTPDRWQEEKETPEYNTITENLHELRRNVAQRLKSNPEPMPEMAYQALDRLGMAMREVLDDPLAIANIAREKGQQHGINENLTRSGDNSKRFFFLWYLTEAMDALHVTTEDIQEMKEQRTNLDNERRDKHS